MGGGMEVHKNKWIEEWNAGRENLEFNFRWTRRSLAVVGLFGLAVPILVYKGIVREFHMQDEDAGRPYRKFLLIAGHTCPVMNGDTSIEATAQKKTEVSLILSVNLYHWLASALPVSDQVYLVNATLA
uniref:Uncharacterized protein n=1 Tax=Oryza barthii TaxID=65489 RepID=A0A0D3EU16_9ORYZ